MKKYEPIGCLVDQVEKSFVYHAPKSGKPQKYEEIRGDAKKLAEKLVKYCPPSRELSIALAKLEESVMWANASIARHEKDDA